MAGLIQQAQGPTQEPVEQAAVQAPQGRPDIAQRVLVAALKIIHSPRITEKLLRIMRTIENPAAAIAQAAVIVMKALMSKARGMPKEIILPVLGKIMEEVAQVGTAAKILTASPEILKQAEQIIIAQMQKQAQPEQGQMPQGQMPPPQPQGLIGQQMGV